MSENTNAADMVVQNSLPAIPDNAGNVNIGGDFWTNLQSFELALRMAKALSSSTVIPKEYQGNPSNTLIALEMSARMNTSPMQVMQNLFVINGRPSWSAQYIIGVINASRKYKHELKFELSGKGDNMECYAWTTDQAGEKIIGPTITMQMARDEGWVQKNGSKWKTMPEVMIRYRAASFFGRLYCSDMIMGIYEREEVIELTADEWYDASTAAEATIAQNANMEVIDADEVTPNNDTEAAPPTQVVDGSTGELIGGPGALTAEQPQPADQNGQMTMTGTDRNF